MGRRPAESSRAAILGAASDEGARLRDAMAAAGIPGDAVELFGPVGDEPVLSEYDGEARIVRRPEDGELRSFDVVLVADATEAERVGSDVSSEALVVDLSGRVEGARLIGDGEELGSADRVAIPHSLSILLARLLVPIDRAAPLRRAAATVLRPAADFGRRGLDELRRQTIALLRFEPPPAEVVGRQLAFNVVPQYLVGPRGLELETRIVRELAMLGAWDDPKASARLVTVPVFHGHSISLHVEADGPLPSDLVREALSSARGVRIAEDEEAGTPVELPEGPETFVFDIADDACGGLWIWAVAAEGDVAAARRAVEIVAFARAPGH